MKKNMDPIFGVRRQEIVFIGCDPMDESTLRVCLGDCLIEDEECNFAVWQKLPDPLAQSR